MFSKNKVVHIRKTRLGDNVSKIRSRKLTSCLFNDKVETVLDTMLERHRKLPVLSKEKKLAGIVTLSDVLDSIGGARRFRGLTKGKNPLNMQIKNFMTKEVLTVHPNTPTENALMLFNQDLPGSFPVSVGKNTVSMLAEWDFASRIKRKTGIKIKDVMIKKPLVLKEDFTIAEVSKIMSHVGFRRFPVLDNGILMGIISLSDVVRYIRDSNFKKSVLNEPVSHLVKKNVITLDPQHDVYTASRIINEKRTGMIPVEEDNEFLGLITERDVLGLIKI